MTLSEGTCSLQRSKRSALRFPPSGRRCQPSSRRGRARKLRRSVAHRAAFESFSDQFAAAVQESAQARVPVHGSSHRGIAASQSFSETFAAACEEAARARTHARIVTRNASSPPPKKFSDQFAAVKEEAAKANVRQDVKLRPLTDLDTSPVVALNEANVAFLAPMDNARLKQLVAWSQRFDVVEFDGQFAGFVIAFAPDSDYDSPNYKWFAERYPDTPFCYLDRIALAPGFRRSGLGSAVYEQVEANAAARGCAMVCLEVSIEPLNEGSVAFHRRKGYTEVGQRSTSGQTVSMQVKHVSV